MPFARGVLDENHLARRNRAGFAVAGRDLHAVVKIDDVLAARRRMPVQIIIRRNFPKDNACRRQALRQASGVSGLYVFDVNVLKVRDAVFILVQSMDFHPCSSS